MRGAAACMRATVLTTRGRRMRGYGSRPRADADTPAHFAELQTVQVGDERPPRKLPAVRTNTGQMWRSYHDLVSLHSEHRLVDAEVLAELLALSGLDMQTYAPQSAGQKRRALYVGVGRDAASVVLLLSLNQFLQTSKAAVDVVPVTVCAPGDTDMEECVPILTSLLRERELDLVVVKPTNIDLRLVLGDRAASAEEWTAEDRRRLRYWVLYRLIRTRERHPLGCALLVGTTLDGNLKGIADRLCPDEGEPMRRPLSYWNMCLGSSPMQLPVLDFANADWKYGAITLHKPLLSITTRQVQNTAAKKHRIDQMLPLLTQPPPVSAKLSTFHIAQLLDLVRSCHILVRSIRSAAYEFIHDKVRLDYRLPWATMDPEAFRKLDGEVAEVVMAAVIGFVSCSDDVTNWLMDPPDAIRNVARQIMSRSVPGDAIQPVGNTETAVVWGTPYHPSPSASPPCFSVLRWPTANRPTVQFAEWLAKSASYRHEPTRCSTEVVFGRWLVRLYTSKERAQGCRDRGTVLYCTRLRSADQSAWYRQFANGAAFQRMLRLEVHNAGWAEGAAAVRPSANMLLDVPLIVAGPSGVDGPSDESEPRSRDDLFIVACPPFGFWSSRMKSNLFHHAGEPVLHRATAFCLRPQWLGEFLPPPGLLGPLFLPLAAQVRIQLRNARFLRQANASTLGPAEVASAQKLTSPEAYDRMKAQLYTEVSQGDAREVTMDSVDLMYSNVVQSMERTGRLTTPADAQSGSDQDRAGSEVEFETGFLEDGEAAATPTASTTATESAPPTRPDPEKRIDTPPAAVLKDRGLPHSGASEVATAWKCTVTMDRPVSPQFAAAKETVMTAQWPGRSFESARGVREQRALRLAATGRQSSFLHRRVRGSAPLQYVDSTEVVKERVGDQTVRPWDRARAEMDKRLAERAGSQKRSETDG